VANLPYYVTSAVLRHLLERMARPRSIVVTVQREVAERIVAEPGAMSLLAVSVQFYGNPKVVARIRAGAFYPPPKVDSSVLRIEVSDRPRVKLSQGATPNSFFRVVRAGFAQRRKTLRNSLAGGLALPPREVEAALATVGIDAGRRAQTLSLDEWSAAASVLVPRLS
jgi:16S rRNA (adenine1518-N6/adenine1519-N6)-dimethyltransferase